MFYPHVQFIITSVKKLIFTNVRAECCAESWNMLDHLFEIVWCFCFRYEVCAEYNVTSSKFPPRLTGGGGIIFDIGVMASFWF